jgi:hypothetical protein
VSEAFLVAMSVPFAMAGGVFLQWALGYAMTTAVIIGYISVFAVAVQTGIIMVIFIREALDHRPADQPFLDAVIQGSTARLRPKLMTVATIVLSLSLIPLSSGPGMEIMKPIAAPSIGGMVTSTLHVLFMTPCLFVIYRGREALPGAAAARQGGGRVGRAGGRRNGYAMTPRALAWIAAASLLAVASCQRAQESTSQPAAVPAAAKTPDPSTDTVYMCPMDKDIRAHAPGKCPRCGMALVTSIPEPAEYHLDVTASPAPAPGSPLRLTFDVTDPWKGNPVDEILGHSREAVPRVHRQRRSRLLPPRAPRVARRHPRLHLRRHAAEGGHVSRARRLLPEAATPQLLAQTLMVPGTPPAHPVLTRDDAPKQAENMTVTMTTSPETPVAGLSARVRFALDPPMATSATLAPGRTCWPRATI